LLIDRRRVIARLSRMVLLGAALAFCAALPSGGGRSATDEASLQPPELFALDSTRGILVSTHVISGNPSRAALFGVRQYWDSGGEDEFKLEPIFVLENGRLTEAPTTGVGEEDTPQTLTWAKDYFSVGRTYRVLRDGTDLGEARVLSRGEGGCWSFDAYVALSNPGAIRQGGMALATDSRVWGRRPTQRLKPTASETAAIDSILAHEIERSSQRADPLAHNRFKTTTHVLDLDGRGSRTVVADLFRISDGEPKWSGHEALVIAERDSSGRLTPSALARGSGQLLDHVDIDGDGMDEIIIQIWGYESLTFEVLKKIGKGWAVIFRGGGYGC
jgi:hypothetical protein